MTYSVTISSTNGAKKTLACGGVTDQDALIFAGKAVEAHADRTDPAANVSIYKGGKEIGVPASVRDMIEKAV